MMKKTCLLVWGWLFPLLSLGQMSYSTPQVGTETNFAGITLLLSPRVQQMVNTEINTLLRPNSFLDVQLERMQLYFPVIESILLKEGVPADFKYVAVLESNLLANAVSESKAVGYWQFKEVTAREVGLTVNSLVDERRHIGLATQGAAMYLKRSQLIYRNWLSTLLSYYYGVTGVTKVIPAAWSGAQVLELNETIDRYLVKAIAYKEAFSHRLDRIPNSMYNLVAVETNNRSLDDIAGQLVVESTQLKEYNEWLLAPTIPNDKNYPVYIRASIQDAARIRLQGRERLAAGFSADSYPQLKRISPITIGPEEPVFYEINGKKGILAAAGDEVAQLAAKGKISIKSFLKFNDMTDRDMVKAGSIYYLQKKKSKANIAFHTVLDNQSLWEISQMYGIRLKKLMVFNRLDNARYVQKGRVLYLQSKRPKNKPIEVIDEGPSEIIPKPTTPPRTETVVTTPSNPTADPATTEEETEIVNVDVTIPAKTNPPVTTPQPTQPTTNVPKKDPVTPSVNTPTSPTNTRPAAPPASPTRPIPANGIHRVAQGESLFSIARLYNLTVDDLMTWNNLSSVTVQYDQVLRLSAPPVMPANVNPSVNTAVGSTEKTHVVAAGETLFSIAKRYGLTVATLQNLNGLTSNNIQLGQTLVVERKSTPAPSSSAPTKVSTGKTHRVEKGDTLFNIAKRYGLTVTELKTMNGLTTESISIGQELKVRK